MRFFYHHPEIGPEFIRRLISEMDVTLFRGRRQGTDWLARGKFPICFFCRGTSIAKHQGLPVAKFGLMKEGAGLVAHGSGVAWMKDAPHPNAARVFINWLLSRKGQLAFMRASSAAGENALDSLRIDIPKDHVPPENRRTEGAKYLDLITPERSDSGPILKVFNEALAESGKK